MKIMLQRSQFFLVGTSLKFYKLGDNEQTLKQY